MVINVALYAPDGNRWAMTERGRNALSRTWQSLRIGPSRLDWDGNCLTLEFDEVSVPRPPAEWRPRCLRGTVRVIPDFTTQTVIPLAGGDGHFWNPIAPAARLEIELVEPNMLTWAGHGYFDSNWGTEPLERGFRHWDWARTRLKDGSAVILYDSIRSDNSRQRLGLRFGTDGRETRFDLADATRLKRGFWGVDRYLACDAEASPVIVRILEDSPFYIRSLVDAAIFGEPVRFMHESLSGRRLALALVKAMLPFRMPRRTGAVS